jgi:single-strand DNA-binding protein
MKAYNCVTLIGRAIGRCELKGEAQSKAVFTLAVDRPYKDADGKHPTDFLPMVAFGKLSEICHDYIKKGCLVLVNGRVQAKGYDTSSKAARWTTEILAESVNILEYAKGDSNTTLQEVIDRNKRQ